MISWYPSYGPECRFLVRYTQYAASINAKRLLPREERLFARIRGKTGAMRTHTCHALLGTAQVLQYVPPITTVLDTLVAQHYLSRPRRQCESRALQCSLQFESHSADIENGLFKIRDRCQNHKLTIRNTNHRHRHSARGSIASAAVWKL